MTPQTRNILSREALANGLRHTEDDADNARAVLGLKGTVGAWDYDTALLYSQSKASSNLLTGYPQYSLFLPILDSGSWDDTLSPNRDFAWARIDVPGPHDLWAVSLHLLTSSTANSPGPSRETTR